MLESKDVEVHVTIKHTTDSAVLVNDGDNDVWLALSLVDIVEDEGKIMVQMPEWLAVDTGLM